MQRILTTAMIIISSLLGATIILVLGVQFELK